MSGFQSFILPLLLALSSVNVSALPYSSDSLIISSHLQRILSERGIANIFVTLNQRTSEVLTTIKSSQYLTRTSKLNALHSALNQHARSSQQPILQFLRTNCTPAQQVQSFWITNQIYIKNADLSLVTALAAKFPDLISGIDEEFIANLIEPVSVARNITLNSEAPQWGIAKIQAPEAWEEIKKRTGLLKSKQNVIVATIDTGVRATHEALKDNFVGDYGWFDPYYMTNVANDHQGHGTHTAGTIAGRKGIGVAPDVKWSACKGCPTVFCFQSTLLACGQFVICPTLTDGSNPDCSHAPHIVSNSWGLGRGNTWYNEVIDAWHVAGIIPIFSIGNSGPVCNTADSPGDQSQVIAVGSTGVNDEISYFSSIGPTMDKRFKPEVVAPGSDVLSAYHTSDDAYAIMSGTSMSCPHTAGTIALLRTINANLDYDLAKQLLLGSADQNLRFSGRVCDGVKDDVFPNHVFGSGRVNALKSVTAQIALL